MTFRFARIAGLIAILAYCAISTTACKKEAAGKGHDHEHSAGDGHDDDHDHAAHGASTSLGTVPIGSWAVSVARQGELTPGAEAMFELTFKGAIQPTIVSAGVGADAAAAAQASAEKVGEHFHVRVKLPSPLPTTARLWIGASDGTKQPASAAVVLK